MGHCILRTLPVVVKRLMAVRRYCSETAPGRSILLPRIKKGTLLNSSIANRPYAGDYIKYMVSNYYIELLLGFFESLRVGRVYQKDDARAVGIVILPDTASLLMASEVIGGETHVIDAQLLRSYSINQYHQGYNMSLLGWRVGWRVARRSVLSM